MCPGETERVVESEIPMSQADLAECPNLVDNSTTVELNDYRGSAQTGVLVSRVVQCWRAGQDLHISLANVDRMDCGWLQVLIATRRSYSQAGLSFTTGQIGESLRTQLRMIGAERLLVQGVAARIESSV